MEWVKVLEENITNIKVMTKTLPQKGNLVYEYNPFRNYRLSHSMYEFQDSLYTLYELYKKFGIYLTVGKTHLGSKMYRKALPSGALCYRGLYGKSSEQGQEGWDEVQLTDKAEVQADDGQVYTIPTELESVYGKNTRGGAESFEKALADARLDEWTGNEALLKTVTNPMLREKGELVDFITDELKFSIEHPVQIVPQHSYDGSVNLILNDGLNIPRLINSRFSVTGKNTYEIIDRRGDNDTNIYDQGAQFDIDTSLYKRTTRIPRLTFGGVKQGGSLPVGNYHFYFKLADADGNETDFVAESGLVSLFIGSGNPSAVTTGLSDENSVKLVKFTLSGIDASYRNVHVFYSRSSAQADQSASVQYRRIEKTFTVDNTQTCNIIITGMENMSEVSSADINLQYNIASTVGTAAACQDMLMMGNIHKPDIPYDELADLSLRFLPYVKEKPYMTDITQDYGISTVSKGYYDPDYIYNSTGYWGGEYYRFGVVYIMPDNELTPVFNIRGRCRVEPFTPNAEKEDSFTGDQVNDGQYDKYKLWKDNGHGSLERVKINVNESDFRIVSPSDEDGWQAVRKNYWENAKGVVSFAPVHDTDTVYALEIRTDDEVVQELKKYVKGWFFVRQERIPTILCQGITIGIDKCARVPSIPTQGGMLANLGASLDGSSYVEVEDINGVNYLTEGFLTRYNFSLKPKSSGFWGSLGKIVAAVAVVGAVAAASIVTAGGAAVAVGGVVLTGQAAVLGAAVAGAAAGAAAAAVSGSVVGAVAEGVLAVERATESKTLNGRNTKVPDGYKRVESDSSRETGGEFYQRVIITDPDKNIVGGIIAPEFEVSQPLFNQLLTGGECVVQSAVSQSTNRLQGYTSDFFTNEGRHFFIPSYYDSGARTWWPVRLQCVPDDMPLVCIETEKYRSRAGFAEEAWHYESVGEERDGDDKKINTDILRGSYGPYIAMSGYTGGPCETVNVMIPGFSQSSTGQYVDIRMHDDSSFTAISDRMACEDMDEWLTEPLIRLSGAEDRSCGYTWELYRGDCYLCQVTHRVNRNFNDPSAPYNDDIVDPKTWKDNYDPSDTSKYQDINLGDVNAVQLGMWLTFKVRSTLNLNIRTLDDSHTDEKIMCGHGRGWYPFLPMDTEGPYKTPESAVSNAGFKKSGSERLNFALPDVPYIKNWFGTRIMYSDIHVNDAYKNGFRVFRGTSYIDCPRTYGEIVKLVELKGSLLVVFEHGVGICAVNKGGPQQNVSEGRTFLNTNNVLSQPVIISDVLGTQWPDSVLKTPGTFGDGMCWVYGVDACARKIWRTNGVALECISDMRVQEFLNKNITFGERELTPVIGVRNIKTFYNSWKRDVLFTFYDNLEGFEEKVWNLCWNELLQMFVTFYSWVPSCMENINNMPFSFNRNTSKWIAKLGMSHAENSFANGIVLTENVFPNGVSLVTEDGEKKWHLDDCLMYQGSGNITVEIMQADSAAMKKVTLTPAKDGDIGEKGSVWWVDSDRWDEKKRDDTVNTDYWRRNLVGILGLTGVNMPTGTDVIYKVDYELERDNFLNWKFFSIDQIGYYCHAYDSINSTEHTALSINSVKIPVYGLYVQNMLDYTSLASELYYRNKLGHEYPDWTDNRMLPARTSSSITPDPEKEPSSFSDAIARNLPVFKDRKGQRQMLPRDKMINPQRVVSLLNVRAKIYGCYLGMDKTVQEFWYNSAKGSDAKAEDTDKVGEVKDDPEDENRPVMPENSGTWVDCGFYESVIAVMPEWNTQFLSTDFWKHGQAGAIDIADEIFPAFWYGEQHPFEFEFVVVNEPSTHKIFTNLEIVSNNVKPESFHYEIVGDAYDFAKDKANMYFRQEALKALYQYNGGDIVFDRNFLNVEPKQNKVSADLPHTYYARQDTFNEIYDSYKQLTSVNKDYDHLTGSEIVYYPDRRECRIWTHQKAVSMDEFEGDSTTKRKNADGSWVYEDDGWEGARALIASNCKYLEDRWRVVINPIVVCYRNEFDLKTHPSDLSDKNSLWKPANGEDGGKKLPPLLVCNSPLPPDKEGEPLFKTGEIGQDDFPPCLKDLGYNDPGTFLDGTDWLSDVDIHGYSWGAGCNREEAEIRDKFVKVRIRYTGDQLAVIDFINTIYQISFA